MRICMITNTYLPHVGGVARSVATLVEDLERKGHEVLVVAPTYAEEGSAVDEKGRQVVRVPAIQNFNGSDFSVRLPIPSGLSQVLNDFQPDIVHSHHPFLLGDTALRIARQYEKPLIFTHHTLYERYTHYVPMDSEVMQQFAVHLSIAYTNLCDAVVAPSDSIASLIRERGTEVPVHVVPTGVDMEFFGRGRGSRIRSRYGIPASATVLGHLGRLAEEKNLRFLAEGVARVLEARPDSWFILAGEGDLRTEIEQYFADLGLAGRVVTTGSCTGQDLADVYRAMDLFLFSSHTETQGMVVTEAMASSLPVIALDAAGVREVVVDGYNGRLLPGEASSAQFAEAVISAVDNTVSEPGCMSAAAQETASRFSRERCAETMLALYQSLAYGALPESVYTQKRSSLDRLAARIKAEWELLSEKGRAAARTLGAAAGAGNEPG